MGIIMPPVVGGLLDAAPAYDAPGCPVNTAGFLPAARSLVSPLSPALRTSVRRLEVIPEFTTVAVSCSRTAGP